MKHCTVKTLLTSTLTSLLLLTTSVTAEEEKTKVSFATKEVSPGIYMLSGVGGFAGGNIGLSVGDDGVVMIDDSMPPMLDIMKKAVKSITSKPVDFLINTHVHGDHLGNNESIAKDGTHIVAHENLRTHLLTKGYNKKAASKGMLPVITFSHSMAFHLNGQDAQLIHAKKAHTDGDAFVYFKQANVIHAGDTFFNGMFPYIDLSSGGSVNGYINAQKRILKLADNNTKIIPGHGPLATKADLKKTLDMIVDAKSIIKKLIKQGKSEDEVVKLNPLKKYHDKWNWQFITTERMTRQMYKGLNPGESL